MKTVKLSDYAKDIEDAMIRYADAFRTETPEGVLEFSIRYSDEFVTVYTGVEFLGAREHYLRPADVSVEEMEFLPFTESKEEPVLIRDYEFDTAKIFS